MRRIGSWWNNVQRLFIRITSASSREPRSESVQKGKPHSKEKDATKAFVDQGQKEGEAEQAPQETPKNVQTEEMQWRRRTKRSGPTSWQDRTGVSTPAQPPIRRQDANAKEQAVEASAEQAPKDEPMKKDKSAMQFQELPSETMDLVIGFDLGTSCSKVIIRSPFALRSRATAVPWHLKNDTSKYLLPTVLYENDYGEFSLVPSDSTKHVLRDLKINLMDKIDDTRAQARATAYIGLALRSARQWLLDTQKDAYGIYHLRWALNIGIPSAGYNDENMRPTFGLVARAAWNLSLQPDLPTLHTATKALRIAGDKSDSDIDIDVVPEIAAEVVGYARSRLRSEGLHVMVDVGASTIDICGFVLHSRDGEDRYELLTALVKRLGIHDLHLRRMNKIKSTNACVKPSVPTSLSPFMMIPNTGRKYINDPSDFLSKKLDEIDQDYVSECTTSLMSLIMAMRRYRDPYSSNWKSGLPVFVAGGGGQFSLVREAIKQAHERLINTQKDVAGIAAQRLPTLETLQNRDIPDSIAGRLAVAYGLSFDKFDIGQIRQPHEIEDVPRIPPRSQPKTPPPWV